MNVEHEQDKNRFVIQFEDGLASLNYQLIGPVMNIMHTEVPESHEGEGVGSALVREALEWAKESGKDVEASCRFAKAWIDRHPEYQDLLTTA